MFRFPISDIGGRVEAADQVGAVYAPERSGDVGAIGRVVPKEVFALSQFFFRTGGSVNFLACIWMHAGIIYFGGYGHWRRSEVLNLFEMKVEVFCFNGKLGHVSLVASGMA